MSRTITLRKRIQVALAALLLLGIGGVVSTAAFTDTATIEGTATAGTLTVDFDGTSSAELKTISGTIFAPGVSASDTIRLQNAGNINALVDIAAVYEAAATSPATTPAEADALAETLQMTWQIEGEAPVTKTLKGWTETGIPTPAGFDKQVTITVAMPDSAANTLQGKGVKVTLNAISTQDL